MSLGNEMMEELLKQDFCALPDLIRKHAARRPNHVAIALGEESVTYGTLDRTMDRVASALRRTGIAHGSSVALYGVTSLQYAFVFLGALRAGVAVAPIAPGATSEVLSSMIVDAGARLAFVGANLTGGPSTLPVGTVSLDQGVPGQPLEQWLGSSESDGCQLAIQADWPFNIIYSSGTTGEPRGIVQSHGMRWAHIRRGARYKYSADATTLLATPLYSNTTLVSFFSTLGFGGTTVLMQKFSAAGYLQMAERVRATHTMLVPVQYMRVMAEPKFGDYDLGSFKFKFCTSAPFAAALKADILARWPGGLVEFYAMTEGGGTCVLEAHLHPTKLHTVGRPSEGHDIRLIDEDGHEVAKLECGEVVGHSAGMMLGYHGRAALTRESEWFDSTGRRFLRTGDIGRFDADGFMVLVDRKKDMIISGGFNVYPKDIEDVLLGHAGVSEAAVVGVSSSKWGETPVAFVVPAAGSALSSDELRDWTNQRVSKVQRLADVRLVAELPRSGIGKILKRELRERYGAQSEH